MYLCLIQIKFNSNTHSFPVGTHMVGLLYWLFVVAKESMLVCLITCKFGGTYVVPKVIPSFLTVTLAFILAGWKLLCNPSGIMCDLNLECKSCLMNCFLAHPSLKILFSGSETHTKNLFPTSWYEHSSVFRNNFLHSWRFNNLPSLFLN